MYAMISDRRIGEACARHGAVRVAEAAYKRLQGDHDALAAVGLPDASNLAEAQHVAFKADRRKARQAVTDFIQGAATGNVELMAASFPVLDYGEPDGGGWARAMRAASRLKSVPPAIREGFLRVYIAHGDHIRQECNDLDLADGLRALLPAYKDVAVRLYRGEGALNRARRTYGLSWSARQDVAQAFAETGMYRQTNGGSVLLETLAPPEAIICAVPAPEDRYDEREYILDRRRLKRVSVVARFPQIDLYGTRTRG